MRALAAGIAALLVVGVVSAAVHRGGDTHHYPKRWDPRVADLAAFVEKSRGLRFDHPVDIDFLSPEAYTKATTAEVAKEDDDSRSALDRGAAQLRALGLVSGPLDLRAVLAKITDAGTLAFYSPDDKRVRVRGTDMSVGLQVTLVHELTHALQDQHFDLSKLLEDSHVDNSASVARRGLAEGDALRTEDAYVNNVLTDDERAAYGDEYAKQLATSQTATEQVPDFIQATFAEPYALGAPFVTMLFDDGGNRAVDAAFRKPPSTEEHLFDPASYLAHEGAKETDVDLRGVDVAEDGPFGSLSWFLVLAGRIDPSTAFQAALGWAGDHYAVFERGHATCIRAVFRGDTEDDEHQMGDALDAWAAAVPGGKAKRIDVKGHPGLEACDPGTDIDLHVNPNSSGVLVLPNVWGYLVAESAPDLGPAGSRCFAARILDGFTYEQLADPGAQAELTKQVAARAVAAYVACGSGKT